MDIPIKKSNVVIAKAVPLKWIGADAIEILNDPITDNAIPMVVTQSSSETTSPDGWHK